VFHRLAVDIFTGREIMSEALDSTRLRSAYAPARSDRVRSQWRFMMPDKPLTVKDLKPCPVCGHEPEQSSYGFGERYTVRCEGMMMIPCHRIIVVHRDSQTAYRIWNSMGEE